MWNTWPLGIAFRFVLLWVFWLMHKIVDIDWMLLLLLFACWQDSNGTLDWLLMMCSCRSCCCCMHLCWDCRRHKSNCRSRRLRRRRWRHHRSLHNWISLSVAVVVGWTVYISNAHGVWSDVTRSPLALPPTPPPLLTTSNAVDPFALDIDLRLFVWLNPIVVSNFVSVERTWGNSIGNIYLLYYFRYHFFDNNNNYYLTVSLVLFRCRLEFFRSYHKTTPPQLPPIQSRFSLNWMVVVDAVVACSICLQHTLLMRYTIWLLCRLLYRYLTWITLTDLFVSECVFVCFFFLSKSQLRRGWA